jgi:hypothetical protein
LVRRRRQLLVLLRRRRRRLQLLLLRCTSARRTCPGACLPLQLGQERLASIAGRRVRRCGNHAALQLLQKDAA